MTVPLPPDAVVHSLATIRDWQLLEDFYFAELHANQRMADRLDLDLDVLEGFFKYALLNPAKFGIVLVTDANRKKVWGAALLMEVGSPFKLQFLMRTFIHGIYTIAWPKAPRAVGPTILEGMLEWARARKHDLLWGNIRLPQGAETDDGVHKKGGFKVRAVEKMYGMTVAHVVLIKEVDPDGKR